MESTPLPEMTSSGAGRALRSIVQKTLWISLSLSLSHSLSLTQPLYTHTKPA
jgi:hypothetical protein